MVLCKISLPVIKFSKKKKRKYKKKSTEDSRHLRLESSIPIPESSSDRHLSVLVILAVLQCLVKVGGGREEYEGSKADNEWKNQHSHMTCLGVLKLLCVFFLF